MNRNRIYLWLLLLLLNTAPAQTLHINLQKSDCQLFGGHFYIFGLKENNTGNHLCVYKYSRQLTLEDSVVIKRNGSPNDYLQLSADTLHNYLNVYLQQKDSKLTSILRLGASSETVALVENTEVARLNSLQVLGAGKYYYKNFAYSVKSVSDTNGFQFYLNKYKLVSEKENFDYKQVWQFPFERKNVHDARVFYADDKFVVLYVIVNSGPKKGNWILRIDAANGRLVKGSKINAPGDTDNYMFGNFFYDRQLKTLHLWGQKIHQRHLNYETGSQALFNLPGLTLYYSCIDSLGEVVQRQEFAIPLSESKSGAKKTSTAFLIKITQLKQQQDKATLEADIYKSQGDVLCYSYSNTQILRLEKKEDTWVLQKTLVSNNTLIEDYFITADKLNLNGKQCAEKLTELHKLFTAEPGMPVKAGFKPGLQAKDCWLLTKILTQKNQINISLLAAGKTGYQLKSLADLPKDSSPKLLIPDQEHYLLYFHTQENQAEVRMGAWP